MINISLYKEILANVLREQPAQLTFPNLKLDAQQIVNLESYRALQAIKTIIEDNRLTDRECFQKIEAIVMVFEELGSGGGTRHDD